MVDFLAHSPGIHIDSLSRYQASFVVNPTTNAERQFEEVTFCTRRGLLSRDEWEEEGYSSLVHGAN
jgi:hypothetical protein